MYMCVWGSGEGEGKAVITMLKGMVHSAPWGEVHHLHDLGGSWYLCKVGHLKGTIILSRGWLSWGEGVVKVRGGHYDMN